MSALSPTLSLILARQHVADLLRSADRQRPVASTREESLQPVGPAYRLPSGSWLFSRRES
jgi:hypothetical protein